MATKAQTVHSVDEFRRLYYPEPDPVLDYLDGGIPDNGDEGAGEGPPVANDPLDRFARQVAPLSGK
ncbi:MAG: hypothetical protein KGL94_05735 [Acidobacteriota bacterium]|nr:hypothetical protein [Acidobacteriota bacterium]